MLESKLSFERENFSLTKATLNDDRSLSASYMIAVKNNDIIDTVKVKDFTPSYECVQELQEMIRNLSLFLAKVNRLADDQVVNVLCHSIEVKGDGDDLRYQLFGTNKTVEDKSLQIKSTVINFKEGAYIFNDEILNMFIGHREDGNETEGIEDLVFKYLFENDRAQLTLGLQSADDVEEAEEVEED